MASDYTSAYTGAQIDEGLARARNDEALVQDQVKADTGGNLILSDDSGNGLTILDGGNITQTSGKYIATDEVRARDSSGLILGDDSGNGLTIADGGNTSLTAGKYHSTDSIRALSASGLGLYDDSGQGPLVNDGGIVTNAYQPAFSAKLNNVYTNVTGDGTSYNITGSMWTEISDVGGTFSNGTHTAPIGGNYTYSGICSVSGVTSSHTYLLLSLITSDSTYYPLGINLYNVAREGSYLWLSWTITCVPMDANDTAYLQIKVSNGSKVIDLPVYFSFSGFLLA